jgi:hypothetical protein
MKTRRRWLSLIPFALVCIAVMAGGALGREAVAAEAAVPDAVSPDLMPVQGQSLGQTRLDIETPFAARLIGLLGMAALLLIGWALSTDRRAIPWRILIWGTALQLIFAVFILRTPIGAAIFAGANDVVVALLGFTVEGARFIFGDLVGRA